MVLNADAPMTWDEVPFISIVPAVASKVPLFVIVPEICNVVPVTVRDEPAAIVKLLTVPVVPELRTGLLGTLGI